MKLARETVIVTDFDKPAEMVTVTTHRVLQPESLNLYAEADSVLVSAACNRTAIFCGGRVGLEIAWRRLYTVLQWLADILLTFEK